MILLGLTESFTTMNQAIRDSLWRPIFSEIIKDRTWNFDTILIQVFNWRNQNLFFDVLDGLEITCFSGNFKF